MSSQTVVAFRRPGSDVPGSHTPELEGTTEPGDQSHKGASKESTASRVVRVCLLMLAAVSIGFALNLAFVSRLEQNAAQYKELARFRYELAAGTAPVSPVTAHRQIALGTPIALLSIPSLHLKQVVDEGTNSEVLQSGPGHLPSTVFPGGLGTSVIYGRAATYGGPFSGIAQLRKGARILVTVQNGPSNTVVFRVTDIRTGDQRVPPIGTGGARITLVTAKESDFVPSGVVYVDANIVGYPVPTQRPVVAPRNLPGDELPLASDTGGIWVLALWLLALAVLAACALWTWNRKGHVQAWIIFVGPLVLVGYLVADHASLLLPNLM
ncbi:MAG TPA: sortase [Acidimicrobiales bacterium]|nr:sortase [Acidimicrobiales bacterium]